LNFIRLISQSADIRQTAAEYLPWLALSPLVAVLAFVGDGVFIGTTHVRELRNAMMASAGLFLACLFFAVDLLGNHGLWASFTVFMVARSGILLWRYPVIERAIQG